MVQISMSFYKLLVKAKLLAKCIQDPIRSVTITDYLALNMYACTCACVCMCECVYACACVREFLCMESKKCS